MAKSSRSPCTLIFVSEGSAARELRVPRNWPWIIVAFTVFCLGLSLLAGRKVRAWVDEGADRIARTDVTAMALAGYSLRTPYKQTKPSAWPLRTTPFFSVWSNNSLGLPRSLRKLRLFDVNAKRSIAVLPFARDGVADPNSFTALREFMRCRRTGHTIEMNPRLIQLLLRISHHFKAAELQIISAHRLADGVVTNETSQHNYGNASDIRVSGVSVETLTQAAKDLGAGGVGSYFRNRFVHVDVREKRYFWREAEVSSAPSPADEANTDEASEGLSTAAALEAELPSAPSAELPAEAPAAAAEPPAEPVELPAAAPAELPAEVPAAPPEAPAAPLAGGAETSS